jgi:hypothetical protein
MAYIHTSWFLLNIFHIGVLEEIYKTISKDD